MELLHQFFVKLGARYVIVTDIDGLCRFLAYVLSIVTNARLSLDAGVIDKKTWLAFLSDLEEKNWLEALYSTAASSPLIPCPTSMIKSVAYFILYPGCLFSAFLNFFPFLSFLLLPIFSDRTWCPAPKGWTLSAVHLQRWWSEAPAGEMHYSLSGRVWVPLYSNYI